MNWGTSNTSVYIFLNYNLTCWSLCSLGELTKLVWHWTHCTCLVPSLLTKLKCPPFKPPFTTTLLKEKAKTLHLWNLLSSTTTKCEEISSLNPKSIVQTLTKCRVMWVVSELVIFFNGNMCSFLSSLESNHTNEMFMTFVT